MYFKLTPFSKGKSSGVEYKTNNTQHIYMKVHLVLYKLMIMCRSYELISFLREVVQENRTVGRD